MTKKEATAAIAQLVKESNAKLEEAIRISDESGVPFMYGPLNNDIGASEDDPDNDYGHRSTYNPKKLGARSWEQGWQSDGWNSSSIGC